MDEKRGELMFRGTIALIAVGVMALLGLRVWPMVGLGQMPDPRYDSSGLPLGIVSYQQVSTHAEAHLYYPGSAVFSRFGGGDTTIP